MTKSGRAKTAGKSPSERIGVLVLGMHRSGTSALTRVLNLLGCDLPKTLMGANKTNEAGHWESLPICRLNDEILSSAGSNWHDWLAFNPGWYSSPRAAEYKEKALALLEEEFGQSRLFVLKDPRICRFAPFWLDVLETAGVKPVVIRPVRNPLEVAESLAARDGFDPALGHLLWLRHVLEAEAASRGLPRFHTSYEALLSGWPRLAAAAQEKLGISWPRLSALTGEEIDAFLTDQLRHHQESPQNVSNNPLLSAWLREAFAIFRRWALEGESAEDHDMLDRIRAEFDAAAPAFSRLISVGQQSATKVQSLSASLEEAQGKLAEAEAAAAAQQEQVEALQRQLEETGSALSESHAAAEVKVQQIADAESRLAEAQLQLQALQAEAGSLRTALAEVRGELSHTQSELAQRRAEADDAAADFKLAEQRHAEELEAARARLAEELQSERARLAAELETERLRHADELASERDRIAVRFDEIASLTHLLREKEQEAAAALERSRADSEAVERRVAEADQARQQEAERAARLASELEAEKSRANAELQKIRKEKAAAEGRLAERFSEIAVMTRLLSEKEGAAQASEEQAAWLREVSAVLLNGSGSSSLKGRLAALLPAPIRLKKQKARLQREGIFDPDAYLAAHPDVAEAGLDPLWHYINHGIGEGRQPDSIKSAG